MSVVVQCWGWAAGVSGLVIKRAMFMVKGNLAGFREEAWGSGKVS
jgi:hypothetical protein